MCHTLQFCAMSSVILYSRCSQVSYKVAGNAAQPGGGIEMVNSVVYLVSIYNEDMRHGNIVWPQPAVAEQL